MNESIKRIEDMTEKDMKEYFQSDEFRTRAREAGKAAHQILYENLNRIHEEYRLKMMHTNILELKNEIR